MFDTLIETKSYLRRTPGGTAASVLMHLTAIGAAVIATSRAGVADAANGPPAEIVYVHRELPRPAQPAPPDVTVLPPLKGFQILVAPVTIPDALPAIDLSRPITDAANHTRIGLPGGAVDGVRDRTRQLVNTATTYGESQVEKAALQIRGVGVPVYPEIMRHAGIEGAVLASFIVDTTGRAVPGSFTVLASTHAQFTDAIKTELPRMRFLPAEIGGRKVRQLVQLPFEFTLKP